MVFSLRRFFNKSFAFSNFGFIKILVKNFAPLRLITGIHSDLIYTNSLGKILIDTNRDDFAAFIFGKTADCFLLA